MPFSTRLLTICLTLTALSLPVAAFAQTAGSAPAPSVPQSATGLASSPAMRIYDGTVVDCFKEVTNVDPLEAARTKNTAALNMDRKVFLRIQECMNRKGVPANFENYFAGKNKEGLSAAQRADLQAIQEGLDSGKAPAVAPVATPPVPVPVPVPPPVMAAPQTVAPPPAAVPVPEPETPKADAAAGSGRAKAPRPSHQYWIKPE